MDLVTIFLIFTLFGGAVKDVDSFIDKDACIESLERGQQNLRVAKRARPELASLELVGCDDGVAVPAPQAPKPGA